MPSDKKNSSVKGHVFYIEPNDGDLGVDQNGNSVPLMSHVEDMCISVALTAEVYPRFKSIAGSSGQEKQTGNNGGKDTNCSTYTISWISYVNGMNTQTNRKAKYNSGHGSLVDNEGNNYLTTYYTEISSEKYIENEIVEGLGITNVDVSFESWYTPTVTIKFIDVRGCALFGREEAIHNEFGELTSENILGVFFSQPYPLFRLQIKGFVGKAVTYQLSISSFKGAYNAQTGNFEMTVQFIGYSYALLTDIPIRYLAAVPYMSYIGRDYWNKHVGSSSWKLSDGTNPITLYDMIRMIGSHVSGSSKSSGEFKCDENDENNDAPTTNDNDGYNIVDRPPANEMSLPKLKDLENLNNKFVAFMDELSCIWSIDGKTKSSIGWRENGCDGKVAFFNNLITPIVFTDSLQKQYKALDDSRQLFGLPAIFKEGVVSIGGRYQINATPHYSFWGVIGLNKIGEVYDFEKYIDCPGLHSKIQAEEKRYNSLIEAKTVPFLMTQTVLGQYCTCISYKDFSSKLSNLMQKTRQTAKSVAGNAQEEVTIDDGSSSDDVTIKSTNIRKLCGFIPYVGDFVKIIMCHLETFVAVMKGCEDNIYANKAERDISLIGKTESTDIPKLFLGTEDEWILPWPALYGTNVSKHPNEMQAKDDNILKWIGDYADGDSEKFDEQKLIISLQEAIAQYSDTNQNVPNPTSDYYSNIPINGADMSVTGSPFINIARDASSITDIAHALGLRMAQLIGIGDRNATQEQSYNLGYADALNFLIGRGSAVSLNNLYTTQGNDGDFAKTVIGILSCDASYDEFAMENGQGKKQHLFEFDSNNAYSKVNGRHPMYVNNGTGYTYSYIYGNNNGSWVSIVPTNIPKGGIDTNPYTDILSLTSRGDGKYYSRMYVKEKDGAQHWMYPCSTNNANGVVSVSAPNGDKVNTNNYLNNQMFCIINKSSLVESIVSIVDKVNKGEMTICDYQVDGDDKMKKVFDRYTSINASDFKKYYNQTYTDPYYVDIVCQKISESNPSYLQSHYYDGSNKDVSMNRDWLNFNGVTYGDEFDTFKKGGSSDPLTTSNLMVKSVIAYRRIGGDRPVGRCSLFGTKLYYGQNTDATNGTSVMERKAYLFLQTFYYKCGTKSKVLTSSSVNNSLIEIVPKWYALLIGAIAWSDEYGGANVLNGLEHKFSSKNKTLISTEGRLLIPSTMSKDSEYQSIANVIGVNVDSMDTVVKNCFISLFLNWAHSDEFKKIIDNCELKPYGSDNIMTPMEWANAKSNFLNTEPNKPSQWIGNGLFADFGGKYASITIGTSGSKDHLQMLLSEGNEAQLDLLNMYYGKYILCRSTSGILSNNLNTKEIHLNQMQMQGYLNGFKARLEDIYKKHEESSKVNAKSNDTDKTKERDITIEMYYTLKHIFDAWLISSSRDAYTIENFFNKSFVFVDTFYQNAYKLGINAETIYDGYQNKESSIWSVIDYVVSKNGFFPIALPEFADHNNLKADDDMSFTYDNLRNMFTPLPYNDKNRIEPTNTFVFMWSHENSRHSNTNTGYEVDAYNISDENDRPAVLNKSRFKDSETIGAATASPVNSNPFITRYSYLMPSFGVAVNRQNNTLFRNINVNMDSPIITSVAAATYEDILSKADSSKMVYFHGQDIYSVYSQYAYNCEVEMMGCAQILPFLYFQVLNLPMWRGTYMIYKVTHSITPGNMVTRFSGMKMSKNQFPFVTSMASLASNNGSMTGLYESAQNGDMQIISFDGLPDINRSILETAKKYYGQMFNGPNTIGNSCMKADKVGKGAYQCSAFVSRVLMDLGYFKNGMDANTICDTLVYDTNRIKEVKYKEGEKAIPGDIIGIRRYGKSGHVMIVWDVDTNGRVTKVISAGLSSADCQNEVVVNDYNLEKRKSDWGGLHVFRVKQLQK